jgi:MFS family permease
MAGDSLLLLVLAIWVKSLTGSNGEAGAVMLTIAAPSLLGPLFGWITDRFRRRPFLIVVDILSGLALLPLLAVHSRADVWIIYVVGIAYGISFTLTGGAFSGLLKELVPDDQLGAANGLFGTAQQGLRLIGPIIGAGLFVTVGGHIVAVIDMVTFGCAALALTVVRVVESRPERETSRWRTEMSAGIRFALANVALRRSTIAVAVAMLMLGAVDALVFAYVGTGLHRSPAFISVLVTVQGVGGLLGAATCSRVIKRIGEMATIALGIAAFGVSIALIVFPVLALGFVSMPICGAAIAWGFVGYSTLQQRETPGALMGRVSTATNVLISGAQTISIGIGAILVSIVDYRILFAIMAVGMLATATYVWLTRVPVGQAEPTPVADEPLPTPVLVAPALDH